MKKFDVQKYLRKNPAVFNISGDVPATAVVIPAYDELENISSTLDSVTAAAAKSGTEILVITVINHPPGADPSTSIELLKKFGSAAFPDNIIPIYLPELSGGVGAARKAGMDAFIAACRPEDLEKCVICSLDADTTVSPDYFSCLLPEVSTGGAISLPFAHRSAADTEHQKAIDEYEAYLRRYVEKLKYAASPYAFFTIGSAFAVRADAYIRAGGMKVRSAGEDFYFLQAVAKSSGVRQLEGSALVYPSPRVSRRVPFGTGPAVASLLSGGKLNEIPDAAFEVLADFLKTAASFEALSDLPGLRAELSAPVQRFLDGEHFFERFAKVVADNRKQPEKLRKAFHEWFDGLKTLKFLHFFSDLNDFDIDKKEFKG